MGFSKLKPIKSLKHDGAAEMISSFEMLKQPPLAGLPLPLSEKYFIVVQLFVAVTLPLKVHLFVPPTTCVE